MTTAQTRQLASTRPIKALAPNDGIQSVRDLADHLHVAAQVELSTIPLYLFSTYSIKVGGHSQWAAPRGALRSMIGIAIEEMLHLALVRNLMVAIGHGNAIRFYDKDFLPQYPANMLHRYNPADPDGAELPLTLERLSKKHVRTFCRVEMPDEVDSEATTFDEHPHDSGQYTSLGSFYRAVELGFERLDHAGKIAWAHGDVRKQYKRGFWNEFGSGKPIRVHDLTTAKQALELIIDQGEGTASDHVRTTIRPGIEDFTHYQKFRRIELGVEGIGAGNGSSEQATGDDGDPKPGVGIDIDDPRAIWPVVSNPKLRDFEDLPAIHSLMELFNAAYCYMLCLLDEVYQHPTDDVQTRNVSRTGRSEKFSRRYGLERNGIAAMQGILYPIAQTLVKTPIEKGRHKGSHAAPSFEYYAFAAGESKKQQLARLCDKAIHHFPELGGSDGVRRQISLLMKV